MFFCCQFAVCLQIFGGGGLCPLVKVWEEIELTGKKNHNSKYFYT
jgi:hypothetical protein